VKKNKWKQLFNWGGLGIGVVGVVFVVRKLTEYSSQIDFTGFSISSLLSLFGLLTAYCFSNVLLALAWRDILKYLGVNIKKKWAIHTYGISQIGKYVPGNIFHFAGRQAIGQAAGLPALPLAKSAVWEIGVIAATGSLFSLLLLPLFFEKATYPLSLILYLVVVVSIGLSVHHWVGASVASAVKWYFLFLTLSGIIFYRILMIATVGQPVTGGMAIGITGVYVIAWLAGLLTPGAPAGIGVREMVFLAILHGIINEGELIKAIVLGRFVTVGGDVFFYIFSMISRYIRVKTERY